MNKIFFVLTSLLIPITVVASFDADLYYGMRNKSEVKSLQEFLHGQGIYSGPVTGNYFQMTRDAVKKFQEREGIKPSLGYFGRLTRAKANALTSVPGSQLPVTENLTLSGLLAKIQELQVKLLELQTKSAQDTPVVVASSSADTTLPIQTHTPISAPAKTNKIIITNGSAREFPAIETNPYKVGEFTLHNDPEEDVLFTNFETILHDDIDSTANRNNKVHFLIRDGVDVLDPLISKTEFTFLLTPPTQTGTPHRSVLLLPFDKKTKADEKKTFSVWIELMKYVRSGTLKIESSALKATEDISTEGSLSLVLTKEPPL